MRQHVREIIRRKASLEFDNFMLDLEKRYELTYGEILTILSDRLNTFSYSLLRDEREEDDQQNTTI